VLAYTHARLPMVITVPAILNILLATIAQPLPCLLLKPSITIFAMEIVLEISTLLFRAGYLRIPFPGQMEVPLHILILY